MEDNKKLEEQEVANVMVNENLEALQEENKQAVDPLEQQPIVENTAKPKVPKTKCVQIMMILSIILLIAVVVLYVLFFTKKDKISPIALAAGENSGLLLTVNNDSIIAHFVLVDILKKDLERETAKYETELKPKYAAWEEKYRNLAINVQNNVLTQTQVQNAEKQLMDEKSYLEELTAKYTDIMSKKELSVHQEIMDSIINATKRVNAVSYKADYVFATSEGSAIICSNPAYDITQEVIEELNNAYNKSHKKSTVK